jgi:hypothetical protein
VKLFGHGHDYLHALRVGAMAYRIGSNHLRNQEGARMAAYAGLCHNADRVLQRLHNLGHAKPTSDAIRRLVLRWLGKNWAAHPEVSEFIAKAVIVHDGINDRDDADIVVVLKDADRCVNLALDIVMRSGQFYPDLCAVDHEHFDIDPKAKYNKPRSVLKDIAYCLDWIDPESPVCVRTDLGRQIAKERALVLRDYIGNLRGQLVEEGVMS